MMEVAERTPADLKGGHLARYKNGPLVLREIAQCPKNELAAFQDIQRYDISTQITCGSISNTSMDPF